ncbi:GNAT family N-acetyltransferase [Pseudoalteromonas sp. HM-SA03]|uniref:GNAT family N-acetyltransferase n=1 Tax=Pseudoalteromonas sp. HM-SA03 TaxID=2029678 RepID=UPI000BAE0F2E|nr:GNAT family N-acetyltransferase [Pseudoalteromonas sp. HM-SA03]PAY01274.1 GNAT family N-acetyltransferase [Pseudoalteromonas sp. HM-SA03]
MISTKRFFLNELRQEHATKRYLSWLKGSEARYITNTNFSLDELRDYIEQFRLDESCFLLGIFDKAEGVHIGNVKFEFLKKDKSIVEMGILIGEKSYQGKGVAAEVICAFAEYASSEFDTELMVLGVSKNNTRAISVYQKIGFKPEQRPLSKIDSEGGLLMSWSIKND